MTFHARDAGDLEMLNGSYDLVTAFECIHDLGNPVGVLQSMRRLAGDKGMVIVMDERVGDSFTAKGNEVEWMMYGWSVLHCLPVGMAKQQTDLEFYSRQQSDVRGIKSICPNQGRSC